MRKAPSGGAGRGLFTLAGEVQTRVTVVSMLPRVALE